MISIITADPELASYQDAVRAWFITNNAPRLEPPYQILFFFWRQIVTYQGEKRMVTKQKADQTNLQKATEDAMQPHKSVPNWRGVIDNDRYCSFTGGLIVEQTKETNPMVGIQVMSEVPNDGRIHMPLYMTEELADAVIAARSDYDELFTGAIDNVN